MQLVGSTLTANKATSGDGGAVSSASNGLQLINDTVVGNTASGNGGALANAGGAATVTQNTINQNTAGGAGGALYNTGATAFRASIVTTNQAGGVANNCTGTGVDNVISADYSLDSGSSCGFAGVGDINDRFGMLTVLGHYGGATMTERLTPVSPAINSAGTRCATGYDQRGVSRPQDGGCDMGALERVVR